MKITTEDYVLSLIIIVVAASVCFGYTVGYQSGQVDALKGKQHYHLLTNSVSNITWEKNP
jgi:hypothetical protein